MDKGQVKARRDKKKNSETGILMGQNTNVFSQLSATYLQNKNNYTEEQATFVNSTQIIEYHDANINRLIALLRKKADVTKAKAALELKEQVLKMNADNLEEFMPTFSQLFLETIVNQQSKQVIDEFISMIGYLLGKHKKIVIKQIATIYAPFLVVNKINTTPFLKGLSMLFNGTDEQIQEKSLVLLMKKDVSRKFLFMVKLIFDCEEVHKIVQPNYQRNCTALVKVIKDFIRMFQSLKHNKDIEGNFPKFLTDIDELLSSSAAIKEYFKIGGKAKGSILQLYQSFVNIAGPQPDWGIEWGKYGKVLCENFLQKDILVQQTLWKNCNRQFIEACLKIERVEQREKYSLFTKYLPKPDQKLMAVLQIGGFTMYKELPNYLRIFPFMLFEETDTHKMMVNKLTFIRKLMGVLLELEDENEARIEAYYEVGCLITERLKQYKPVNMEEKKAHEIMTIVKKTLKEVVENLQDRFYSHPPASRNSFTFYVPPYFCKLLQTYQPDFSFIFNPHHVFQLYSHLRSNNAYSNQIRHKILGECSTQELVLSYLENFPSEIVKIDMSQQNSKVEISSKIFLLSKQAQSPEEWFQEDWDLRKEIVVYDPRITQNDLNSMETEQGNYYFQPSQKLAKLYDNPEYDGMRLKFFINCLRNADYMQVIPMLLPMVRDKMLVRHRDHTLKELLKVYEESAKLLEARKWMVGGHQVLKIRVTSEIIIECLTKGEGMMEEQMVDGFMCSCCLFALAIHNYKMEQEAEQLLKSYCKLAYIEKYQDKVVASARKTINESYYVFARLACKPDESGEDRIRKNRLNRCLSFVHKLLWHCSHRLQPPHYLLLFQDMLSHKEGWQEAHHRPDMWLLTDCLLSTVDHTTKTLFLSFLVERHQQYGYFIALVMCCQIILPLQSHIEGKKHFIHWQASMLKHIRKEEANTQFSLMKQLIGHCLADNHLTLVYGAKILLKNLLKNYQQMDGKLLQDYLHACVQTPFHQISTTDLNGKINAAVLITSVCAELPMLDIQSSHALYEQIYHQTTSTTGNDFLINASVLASFWESGVGFKQFQQGEEADKFLSNLFAASKASLSQEQQSPQFRNLIKYCMLCVFNALQAVEKKDMLGEEWDKLLHHLLWGNIESGTLKGIVQTARMKLISKVFMTADKQLKKRIVEDIPVEALKQVLMYQQALKQMEGEDEEGITNQNTISMFIEFAEVLMKIANGLDADVYPEESVVLGLLQSPFAGIKRTSFLLLKGMYEMTVVRKEIPKQFKEYLQMEWSGEEQLEQIVGKLTTYLYSWQTLLYRRGATETTKKEEQAQTLQDYLLQDMLYEQLLKNIFQVVENQLQFNKKQQDYNLSVEELVTTDTVIVSEEQLNIHDKVYRLAMRTLFLVVENFPLFLKDFMDHHKKYKNLCDRLLRTLLSEAIFRDEIAHIEMKEHEWKSMGNFQIYVTPKNKEIYAEYTHDTIRIGLRLVMRSNYPLTPIAIEFGDGLKMEDSSRWALMLQSQLHSRNNSIINGILLWKENIDKKLSGVEECSICFDIVNNSGQLPKKGCKTCHKKFHGNCIMKWFNKSNKSQCPLCKSQFL